MRTLKLLVAVPMLLVMASSASALPPFQKEFQKEYLETLKDQKFAAELEKSNVKCLVCHQGRHKKNRNAFGMAVGKFLTKKDAKHPEKIAEGLKKALAMHVDPKDPKSETFLDRLKAGKWPGGDLADLKKEPKKSSSDSDEKKE
jgi:hypothetical protein